MKSVFYTYIETFIFNFNDTKKNYTIKEITLANKSVNAINTYVDLFKDQFNLTKVSYLPQEPIRLGKIIVIDNKTEVEETFLFVLDEMRLDLTLMTQTRFDEI